MLLPENNDPKGKEEVDSTEDLTEAEEDLSEEDTEDLMLDTEINGKLDKAEETHRIERTDKLEI